MKPFCDIDQYCKRYGSDESVDYLLLNECLKDASYKIVAELESHGIDWKARRKHDKDYGRRLTQVCRDMAYRAVCAENTPDIPFGATQYQTSADGFSAMASFGTTGGGYGELYLTRADRKLLGIGIQRMFTIEPKGLDKLAKKTRYHC